MICNSQFTMFKFKLKYFVALIFLNTIVINEAARILAIFPTPSISHQVVYRVLTQELAKRGHEVVVVTPDPVFPKGQAPANLTEIDVHDISYETWQDFVTSARGNNADMQEQIMLGFYLSGKIFVQQMQTSEVQQIINDKSQKFDLLLVEACVRPAIAISHIYNAPLMLVSSFGAVYGNYEVMGAPMHPILYPTNMRKKIYNLSLWDKIVELYSHYKMNSYYLNELEALEDEMLRKGIDPNIPTLNELKNNVHMILMNIHPIWEGNYPVPPGVIYMGGLHLKPEKDLPEDLKQYLDTSKNGVIYVSFGTNVKPSLMKPDKIKMFVKVFAELPFDILWKWDMDELPGRTKNIRIFKWLPQSDLLRHPKIKLFITQGGLQSTDEAISAGVPLIGMPMLADQWYNVEKYVYHRIGMHLEVETVTEAELKNAINTVITDESYRNNIVNLRKLMRDQPQSSLDRAVWWTEYVLRHGGAKHLRAPAANISWSQYLELELIIIIFGILTCTIAILFCTLYYFWTLFTIKITSLRTNKKKIN